MRVTISALAFDVLWQHHALGEKPPALATVPSPGATMEERRELERRAWREIQPLGVNLTAAMSLLRKPPVEYFGWFGGVDRSCSAHVAVVGTAALLVVVAQDQVTLETVPAALAAEALVSALPPMPPGRGGLFSVPEKPVAQDSLLVRVHPEDADVRRCRQLLEQPRTGAGFFVSATRDRTGRRRTSSAAVHYFDTGGGRYLCVRQAGADGAPWLLVGPAAAGDLVSRLRAA
ncbi:ESX secretion-associated protein EspG [Allokutzneria oryzae]|uniref:ESX secretion-associated protein EspG n=1 Tax=Allokutzneria oryzae TaxID=1378989 RepID=A0ABV5ZRC1_9PSEU